MPTTIRMAMTTCGANDVIQFASRTAAQHLAEDCFGDDYPSILDKTYSEFKDDLKSFSALTVANGRITLDPRTKRNIRAFIQFVKDQLRTSMDPSLVPFEIANASLYLRNEKTHKAFVDNSSSITETTKPARFTQKIRWDDWSPTFVNFLRSIPGRNGIPLAYVIRMSVAPVIDSSADFLQNYINRAPLNGPAFCKDAMKVHIYLVNFTAGNVTAETKILPNSNDRNGRIDFINLHNHYEGVGINSIDIVAMDNTLITLYYSGEKKPHMWWEEFERRLTRAFTIYDKREGRQVYSNEMKLRCLVGKIDADFLQLTKSTIDLELTRVPITMTYELALAAFRNNVNKKHPPDLSSGPTRVRRLQGINTGRGERGRGERDQRFHGRGRGGRYQRGGGGHYYGRGGREQGRGHGRGRFGQDQHPRPGSRNILMTDGTMMAIHPAIQYAPDVWFNIPEHEHENIARERQEHREQQGWNTRQRT